jgi:hypothetical protein
MYQYSRLVGWLTVDKVRGGAPSSGESLLQPMQNGTVVPLSSVTWPATGEGGKPSP